MKYIVILIIFAVNFGYPYGAEILASVIGVFGLIYYYLSFRLAAGLNRAEIIIGDVREIQSTTLSVLANFTAVMTLIFSTPYAIVGWLCVPWVVLTLMTVSISWLMYFKFIEINPVDDE